MTLLVDVIILDFVPEMAMVAVHEASVVSVRLQVSVTVTTAELKGVVMVAVYAVAASVMVASCQDRQRMDTHLKRV